MTSIKVVYSQNFSSLIWKCMHNNSIFFFKFLSSQVLFMFRRLFILFCHQKFICWIVDNGSWTMVHGPWTMDHVKKMRFFQSRLYGQKPTTEALIYRILFDTQQSDRFRRLWNLDQKMYCHDLIFELDTVWNFAS